MSAGPTGNLKSRYRLTNIRPGFAGALRGKDAVLVRRNVELSAGRVGSAAREEELAEMRKKQG
jgi:hypothetical protein